MGVVQKELRLHIDFLKGKGGKKALAHHVLNSTWSPLYHWAWNKSAQSSVVSCPILCDLVDWSPLDSSVHGILQERILEWVGYSRGSSRLRDQTHISCIGRHILYHCTIWEAYGINSQVYKKIYIYIFWLSSLFLGFPCSFLNYILCWIYSLDPDANIQGSPMAHDFYLNYSGWLQVSFLLSSSYPMLFPSVLSPSRPSHASLWLLKWCSVLLLGLCPWPTHTWAASYSLLCTLKTCSKY